MGQLDEMREMCIGLAKKAMVPPQQFDPDSKELILALREVCQALIRMPGKVPPQIGEYVFLPIHSLLQQDWLGESQTEAVLEIIGLLLTKAWASHLNPKRAVELAMVVPFLMNPTEMPGQERGQRSPKFSEKSVEFHRTSFRCLDALYRASVTSKLRHVVDTPAAVVAVTQAIEILGKDDDVISQKASLDFLITVISRVWESQPDKVALILPKTTSQLLLFILGRINRVRPHFSARVLGLRALETLIVGCLGDAFGTSARRSTNWKSEAANNIAHFFKAVKKMLETTSQPQIVEAVLQFAVKLCEECTDSLTACLPSLMGMILYCAGQSLHPVAGDTAFKFLQKYCTPRSKLGSVLETELQSLIEKLDLGAQGSAAALTSVSQALRVVPTASLSVIEAVQELKLTVSPPQPPAKASVLLLDFTKRSGDVTLDQFGLQKTLAPEAESALIRVLHGVGSTQGEQALSLISDQLQSHNQPSINDVRLLWLAGHIINGLDSDVDPDCVYELTQYCYDSVISSKGDDMGPHTALVASTLAKIAQFLGNDFRPYFVDILYPLFGLLGSSDVVVQTQAQTSLTLVAEATGYMDVATLVVDNRDYILDGVSHAISTLDINPSTTAALAAVIWVGGDRVVPYLDDIVASLFVLLDHYHAYHHLVAGVLVVFRTLVRAVRAPPPPINNAPPRSGSRFTTLEDLESELNRKVVHPDLEAIDLDAKISELNFEEEKTLSERLNKNEDSNSPEPDSDDEEGDSNEDEEADDIDEPQTRPDEWNFAISRPVYTMLRRIAGYCDRLVTHESSDIRSASLSLMAVLIPPLALNEKEFLPQVHQMWPQLVERLFDHEVFVVELAFECMAKIAAAAGDFVARRFANLWPRLVQRYGNLVAREWPQFSRERREVVALVKCVEQIVRSVSLPFETMEVLARTYRPAFMRRDFQELYGALNDKAGDLLWLVMLNHEVVPSLESLSRVKPLYAQNNGNGDDINISL